MTQRDRSNPKGREAVEGILGGLEGILGKIADLAEKAESIQKEGSFETNDGREGRYQVGFNISTLGGQTGEREIKVEPFGDVKRDERTGEAEVAETREPPTDVFDEDGYVLVIVEMPGVGDAQATFDIAGDVLTIEANSGRKRYRKEVLLPSAFAPEQASLSANNGVFEIRLDKAADGEAA